MIDSKSFFYAINRVFLLCKSSAHVVNQHVNLGELLMKACGQLTNRSLRGEVRDKESGRSSSNFGNCFQCDVSSIGVSANNGYCRPLLRQSYGSGETYSGIRS